MTPVALEPSLKYHPCMFDVLTQGPESGSRTVPGGWFDWGGLLPKRVTEEHEGWLILVGHQEVECNGISQLNCETDRSSRYESRS